MSSAFSIFLVFSTKYNLCVTFCHSQEMYIVKGPSKGRALAQEGDKNKQNSLLNFFHFICYKPEEIQERKENTIMKTKFGRIVSVTAIIMVFATLMSVSAFATSYGDNAYTSVQVTCSKTKGTCSAVADNAFADKTYASVSIYNAGGTRIGYVGDDNDGFTCSVSKKGSDIASAYGASSVKIGSNYYTGASATDYAPTTD